MQRRFPGWAGKVNVYVCAPSENERAQLGRVRYGKISRSAGEGTRFLWIGRWAPHKGIESLRRFMVERAATHPKDVFTIAGCGSSPVGELPVDLIESGRIRVVPSFKRTELPLLMAEHDAGLFTSEVEGWGISLNEMLEAGLPVYATLAGGVADLRDYWGSSLLPFPPPQEMRPSDTAADDLDAYFSRFSWQDVALRYESLVLNQRA